MNRCLVVVAAALIALGAGNVMAQDNGNGGNGGGFRRGGFGGGRPDPAVMMENFKTQLGVTNSEEWSALQPLVQKVMDARRDIGFGGGMRGLMGSRRNGGEGGDQADRPQRRGPAPSAEATALEKAIESNASKADLKAALNKYVASRKAKQAALEQAQENLRKCLTPRQEAIAMLNGLL